MAELGQKCLEPAPTLKYGPLTAASLYSAFESRRYFNDILQNTLSRNKRRKKL